MAVGYQSFYQAQLTANISDTDLTIPLDVVPTPDEGFLVIESTVANKREIIYYTSKTTTSVVCPSGAGNGRGYDGTTAVSHLQGAAVIMAPVGAMFSELRQQFTTTPQGWTNMAQNITGVTANGNGSYDLTFDASVASILSDGMRLRITKSVAGNGYMGGLFNGSSHYFTRTAAAPLNGTLATVTNNLTLETNYQLDAYPASRKYIGGRADSTPNNGFGIAIEPSGQVIYAIFNGGTGNSRTVTTYQSLPLNKKTHIAVSHTGATILIYFDGIAVPTATTTTGTAPTTAGTGGDFSIGRFGAWNSAYSSGYASNFAVFDAVLSAATIRQHSTYKLIGNETNCIGAWSLDNTPNDQSSAGNNLTATGGVGYTAMTPHGQLSTGVDTTKAVALVMAVSGSTATVQVPEGCTIPTTGGVSAVAYSTQANPFGWVSDKGRWGIEVLYPASPAATYTSTTWYNIQSAQIFVPVGAFSIGYDCPKVKAYATFPYTTYIEANVQLSVTSANAGTTEEQWRWRSSLSMDVYGTAGNNTTINGPMQRTSNVKLAAATPYYLNYMMTTGGTSASAAAMNLPYILKALPAGL